MRHSIPRKVAQHVATLQAGSQTKDGAAIHGESSERWDLHDLSRISLDRRRGQLEDIRQGR
ncbi:hypothetical protein [Bradyrhizobium sp. RP6]|uniref:hypothetical protein n=1 Tax=Bradyrhizobium sp. RP6 TaxID=2489596 RepID=UPI000F547A8E|nr:hypothetical protein [Bradyrhizobium sp. RP6]RQH16054.1 hypothetical protein EHH60_02385 [Bradyrhizobium sp. RP6]